jgi:hypothetical protein
MPILEGFNPFSWDERVKYILEKQKPPIYELEPHQIQMGIITLITDENNNIHILSNGRFAVIGGIPPWNMINIRERIEVIDRSLRKKYKIVKIEAFLPMWALKNLYLPYNWKPYKKSRKKRII